MPEGRRQAVEGVADQRRDVVRQCDPALTLTAFDPPVDPTTAPMYNFGKNGGDIHRQPRPQIGTRLRPGSVESSLHRRTPGRRNAGRPHFAVFR
jgi:hypothetical protein